MHVKHVYSPGAEADNTLGTALLFKHKPNVTLVICSKFLPYKSVRDQI